MAMKAIGTYRTIMASGDPMLYGEIPIYGQRRKYLPMPKREMNQVLVRFLRWFMWINVDLNDITLKQE